jgi:hypothetical protein
VTNRGVPFASKTHAALTDKDLLVRTDPPIAARPANCSGAWVDCDCQQEAAARRRPGRHRPPQRPLSLCHAARRRRPATGICWSREHRRLRPLVDGEEVEAEALPIAMACGGSSTRRGARSK